MSHEIRMHGLRLAMLLVVAIAILVSYLTYPLLDGIVLGMVFAYVGRPIRDLCGSRRRLGSLVATISIVIPITIIMGLGAIEIANQLVWLAQHQSDIAGIVIDFVLRMEIPPSIFEELRGSLQNILAILTSVVAGIPVIDLGHAFTLGIINFILALPVCYFLLVDGEGFAESIIMLFPDRIEVHRRYFSRIDRILSGIFVGSIYTSIVGGAISAIVFYSFGVPRPFALASFVFIAGMVPLLTAWAVIIPVAGYRYLVMSPWDGLIFFIVASLLIYLPTELVIRPYLVSTRSTIHPLLVMVSFLGGMLVAGIGGFFLAPALMGVLVGVYQVRREDLAASPPPDGGG